MTSKIKKHSISTVIGVVAVAMLLLLVASASAGLPLEVMSPDSSPGETLTDSESILGPSATLFSYQGELLDADGNPIDGSVEMIFALYHEESGGTAFWIESHTGAQAITVTDGLFHVQLGSLTPLDPAELTGDAYLELAVNGETLTPREVLTSVAYALEATTLPAGATTRGDLVTDGTLIVNGNLGVGTASPARKLSVNSGGGDSAAEFYSTDTRVNLLLYDDTTTSQAAFSRIGDNLALLPSMGSVGIGITNPSQKLQVNGTIYANGDLWADNHLSIYGQAYIGEPGVGEGGEVTLREGSSGNAWVIDNYFGEYRLHHDGQTYFSVYSDGTVDAHGHSFINCGALVEANLQTEDELEAGRIDRFQEGDVLCWGTDQLELCSVANDRLVQAVADVQGRPIVIGAEAIKVLGPVQRGDILVASNVPGFAMVNNDPLSGSVIAQALEDFDGERGLIRAMIRKF
jgi:hypothetical protein